MPADDSQCDVLFRQPLIDSGIGAAETPSIKRATDNLWQAADSVDIAKSQYRRAQNGQVGRESAG